jgi:hypothetical protein
MGTVEIGISICSSNNCTAIENDFDLLLNPLIRKKTLEHYRYEPHNLNTYLYVSNNPIRESDKCGLFGKIRFIECAKWAYLCFIRGRKCREELEKKFPCETDEETQEWIEWNEKTGRRYPALDEYLRSECWAKIPACIKKLEWCTRTGVEGPQ